MAWPYGGNWNGLNVTQLPEIMAALATAYNERLLALNSGYDPLPTFTTEAGQKTWPVAADFYGMDINGQTMNTFMAEINTRITGGLLNDRTFRPFGAPVVNVYHPVFYANGAMTPLSLSNATNIQASEIKPTALCANFWNRLKDVCDAAIKYKVFVRAPSISASEISIESDIYSDPDIAWSNVNDNTATSGAQLIWSTTGGTEIGTTNKWYQASQRDDIGYTYTGTEVLSGSVIDGRLFASSQVQIAFAQGGNAELANPIDLTIGGQSFTVPVENTGDFSSDANLHSIAYTGWLIGFSSSFSLTSNQTPTESPFTGTVTVNEGTELETTLTKLGRLTVDLRRLSNSAPFQDYTFSAINPFLVIDISGELTDQA